MRSTRQSCLWLGNTKRWGRWGKRRELCELRAVPASRSGEFRQAGFQDSAGGAPGVALGTEG
eukprot:scaffold131740_cov60-Phaeocystis_antarctica.AAC.4